jgi:hypothetical protein
MKPLYEGYFLFSERLFRIDRVSLQIYAFPYTNGYGRKRKGGHLKTSLGKNGYLYSRLHGVGHQLHCLHHRLVYLNFIGDIEDGKDIHHIDGDRTNNRVENLKMVTRRENLRSKMEIRGRSKYRGVCFDKQTGKWRAKIRNNYTTISIGRFETEEIAAHAYNKKALEYGYDLTALNAV